MDYPFVDIHTHISGAPYPSIFSVRIGKDAIPDSGYYSAGVHPWDAETAPEDSLNGIIAPRLAAIGETGLDYVCEVDRKMQIKWFERQLKLARENALPVIVHCVRAYNDLADIIGRYSIKAVIIHGFTGSPELALQLIEKGYFLSFGKSLAASSKTAEALKIVPAGNIFLETDTSIQGIEAIYSDAAGITGYSVEELKENIYMNYLKIFKAR